MIFCTHMQYQRQTLNMPLLNYDQSYQIYNHSAKYYNRNIILCVVQEQTLKMIHVTYRKKEKQPRELIPKMIRIPLMESQVTF